MIVRLKFEIQYSRSSPPLLNMIRSASLIISQDKIMIYLIFISRENKGEKRGTPTPLRLHPFVLFVLEPMGEMNRRREQKRGADEMKVSKPENQPSFS